MIGNEYLMAADCRYGIHKTFQHQYGRINDAIKTIQFLDYLSGEEKKIGSVCAIRYSDAEKTKTLYCSRKNLTAIEKALNSMTDNSCIHIDDYPEELKGINLSQIKSIAISEELLKLPIQDITFRSTLEDSLLKSPEKRMLFNYIDNTQSQKISEQITISISDIFPNQGKIVYDLDNISAQMTEFIKSIAITDGFRKLIGEKSITDHSFKEMKKLTKEIENNISVYKIYYQDPMYSNHIKELITDVVREITGNNIDVSSVDISKDYDGYGNNNILHYELPVKISSNEKMEILQELADTIDMRYVAMLHGVPKYKSTPSFPSFFRDITIDELYARLKEAYERRNISGTYEVYRAILGDAAYQAMMDKNPHFSDELLMERVKKDLDDRFGPIENSVLGLNELLDLFDYRAEICRDGIINLIDNRDEHKPVQCSDISDIIRQLKILIEDTVMDGERFVDDPNTTISSISDAYNIALEKGYFEEAIIANMISHPERLIIDAPRANERPGMSQKFTDAIKTLTAHGEKEEENRSAHKHDKDKQIPTLEINR